MRLGVQVSSFKPYLQSEAEMRRSFEKIARMGCKMVQLQWIAGDVAPKAVAAALAEYGLESVSTQDTTDAVLKNWEYTLRLNRLCGSRHVCISGIPGGAGRGNALRFAETAGRLARRLETEGMVLSFHPRMQDYAAPDGVSGVELLRRNLPETVRLGLDLYHAVRAGQDVEALLAAWRGRVDFVHCKDYLPGETEPRLVPVGAGAIDWPPLLAACEKAGVPWVFAEQETWEKDAFECMEESLAYLKGCGVRMTV